MFQNCDRNNNVTGNSGSEKNRKINSKNVTDPEILLGAILKNCLKKKFFASLKSLCMQQVFNKSRKQKGKKKFRYENGQKHMG